MARKRIFELFLSFIICSVILFLSLYTFYLVANKTEIEIDLPEEYKQINKNTPIEGYYNNKGVLVIKFKHYYNGNN